MSTPATKPDRMATYSPQCSMPSRPRTRKKEMMAIRIADRFVPRDSAFSSVR